MQSACHGERRAVAGRAVQPLRMAECLDCHRDPAPNLRPRSAVFAMGYEPAPSDPLPQALLAHYGIDAGSLDDCSICHR